MGFLVGCHLVGGGDREAVVLDRWWCFLSFLFDVGDEYPRVHTIQEITNSELLKAYYISGPFSALNLQKETFLLLLFFLFQSISGRADWIIRLQRLVPINFVRASNLYHQEELSRLMQVNGQRSESLVFCKTCDCMYGLIFYFS